MRMIETFTEGAFKVTTFQTDQRYLLQAEDQDYILSWKVSKEIPYQEVKDQAINKLTSTANDIWPQLKKHLQLKKEDEVTKDNFPNII